jgi:hypothetical protein
MRSRVSYFELHNGDGNTVQQEEGMIYVYVKSE